MSSKGNRKSVVHGYVKVPVNADHYALLDVKPTSTKEQIRDAYRKVPTLSDFFFLYRRPCCVCLPFLSLVQCV